MSCRILLADAHVVVRQGLRSLWEKQPGVEVVGEAENGRRAVELALKLAPDVVVLDVALPELNGIEATRRITRQIPGTKVVALSTQVDREVVVGMLRAGAAGFLSTKSAFEELVEAIHRTCKGEMYLSPNIVGLVVEDYLGQLESGSAAPSSPLTDREREVLQLLAEGLTTKQIAARLFVSVHTVGTHRRQVMKKLGLQGIAELTRYAIRERLTFIDAC